MTPPCNDIMELFYLGPFTQWLYATIVITTTTQYHPMNNIKNNPVTVLIDDTISSTCNKYKKNRARVRGVLWGLVV